MAVYDMIEEHIILPKGLSRFNSLRNTDSAYTYMRPATLAPIH